MRLAPQGSGSQGPRLWVLVWKRGQAWRFLSRCGAARRQDMPKSSPEVSEGSCKPPFFIFGGPVHPVPLGQRVSGSLSSLPCALSRQSPLTPQSLCWTLGGRDKELFPAFHLRWPRGSPMAIRSRRPVASPVPGGLVMSVAGGGGAGPEDQGGAPKVASAEGICS